MKNSNIKVQQDYTGGSKALTVSAIYKPNGFAIKQAGCNNLQEPGITCMGLHPVYQNTTARPKNDTLISLTSNIL
jgi:hypothetical protein